MKFESIVCNRCHEMYKLTEEELKEISAAGFVSMNCVCPACLAKAVVVSKADLEADKICFPVDSRDGVGFQPTHKHPSYAR